MTRWVSAHQDVWGYREEHLGGRTLESDQAYAILESPATRYFSAEFLEALEVPVVGHAAEVASYAVDRRSAEVDHRVSVMFNDLGVTKTARYAPHWLYLPEDEPVHSLVCDYEDPARSRVKSPDSWPLVYRDRQGFKKTVYPWPGSLLGELRERAYDLSRYLGWTEEQAVRLLLTGEAPYLSPLRVRLSYNRGKPATVKMEAAAWMPAEVVSKNLRNVQQQVLANGSDKLPLRSLEVCVFVEKHLQDANEGSVWPDLWNKWNADNPDKRYKNFRGFRQAYVRNMPKIVQSYEHPNLKPSPEAEKTSKEITERLIRILEGHIDKHGDRFLED